MSPRKNPQKKRNLVEKRPTEVITGVGGAGAVFALLQESGAPVWVAIIVAIVALFVPSAISEIVDRVDS
jgi:hypothetical protein